MNLILFEWLIFLVKFFGLLSSLTTFSTIFTIRTISLIIVFLNSRWWFFTRFGAMWVNVDELYVLCDDRNLNIGAWRTFSRAIILNHKNMLVLSFWDMFYYFVCWSHVLWRVGFPVSKKCHFLCLLPWIYYRTQTFALHFLLFRVLKMFLNWSKLCLLVRIF